MQEIYAIKNYQGKWFKRVGRGRWGGRNWQDELKDATVYTKISTARQIITTYANWQPNLPSPSLVKIALGEPEIVDETARVEKAKQRKATQKLRREVKYKEYQRQRAEENLQRAKKKLEELNR
jgi:hypothetical protein